MKTDHHHQSGWRSRPLLCVNPIRDYFRCFSWFFFLSWKTFSSFRQSFFPECTALCCNPDWDDIIVTSLVLCKCVSYSFTGWLNRKDWGAGGEGCSLRTGRQPRARRLMAAVGGGVYFYPSSSSALVCGPCCIDPPPIRSSRSVLHQSAFFLETGGSSFTLDHFLFTVSTVSQNMNWTVIKKVFKNYWLRDRLIGPSGFDLSETSPSLWLW